MFITKKIILRYIRLIPIIIVSMLIVSCAPRSPAVVEQIIQPHNHLNINPYTNTPATVGRLASRTTTSAKRLSSWTISGRLGVITPKGGHSASYVWNQRGRYFNLRLIAPLGTGTAVLSGRPGAVRLKNEQGKIFKGPSAESVLRKQLGWALPVSNLYYWIRGLPAPGISAKKRYDRQYLLRTLIQQGWFIQYLRYTRANGITLPKRMNLSYRHLKIKIFINRWRS